MNDHGPNTAPAGLERPSTGRHIRWWPLVVVTTANYLWQIPYALHQYGSRWDTLPRLSIPLIVTGLWFAAAVTAAARDTPRGRTALAAYLVTEVAFYVVHNATGAFASDLPDNNPVLLIASLLGYASALTALAYLTEMVRKKSATKRAVTDPE